MNDRSLRDHRPGPVLIDLSVIVALLIAVAAVAAWIAVLAALIKI